MRTILDISERRACRYLCANRRMVRYVGRRPDDWALRKRLEELAAERRRFGFRRLTVLLRREGVKDNVKRILRVYREANLQVRRRVKRRVALGRGNPVPAISNDQRAVVARFHARHATNRAQDQNPERGRRFYARMPGDRG